MGIKKRTITIIRCDVPAHVGGITLTTGESFHLLYHADGQSVVVCEGCWQNIVTPDSVIRLIGQTNAIQKVKKDEGEVDL